MSDCKCKIIRDMENNDDEWNRANRETLIPRIKKAWCCSAPLATRIFETALKPPSAERDDGDGWKTGNG